MGHGPQAVWTILDEERWLKASQILGPIINLIKC